MSNSNSNSNNGKLNRELSLDGRECVDISEVIAEFPNNDDFPHQIPVKKLVETFESCAAAHRNNNNNNATLTGAANEGTMKVYLRVRPTQSSESTIIVENEHSIITTAPECSKRALYTKTESRHYMFTRVFDTTSTQAEVYEHSAQPLLKRLLAGDNCVLFAYGMTNAGKTHTVQGKTRDPGILPRLVSAIFELPDFKHASRNSKSSSSSSSSSNNHWELHASMLEIYQENIYDLLGKRREKLNIRDGSGKVEVAKLSYHALSSPQDAFKMMETAAAKRTKSSTYLNTGSSRSHALYTLTLTRPGGPDGKETISSQFQIVDLAGAERGTRTKATLAQQKEANNINTSLMQLWRCLQAVKRKNAELNGSMEVIPFRESKLTHLLMPILSRAGLGGVAMIACVNPQVDDYDETISILGNASIASKIREFADVGRVAAHTQAPPAIAAAAAAVAAAEKEKAEKEKAEKEKEEHKKETRAGVKRKRFESTISTTLGNTATVGAPLRETRSRKNSANNAAAPSVSAKNSLENTEAIEKEKAKEKKRESDKLKEKEKEMEIEREKEAEREREREAGESERKRLRREVEELRASNEELLGQSLQRETAIRVEVGREMHTYTSQLIAQIDELRAKLKAYESEAIEDVRKSVRKVRRKQLQAAQDDTLRDLEEAEEEMRRLKAEHDIEVFKLQSENKRLADELQTVKQQLAATQIELGPSRLKKVFSPHRGLGPREDQENSSINVASTVAAQDFSSRFHREKSQNTVSFELGNVEKKPVGSPSRSPLSPLSANQLCSHSQSPVRSLSPLKTSHASAAAAFQFNKSPINLHALAEVANSQNKAALVSSGDAVDPSMPIFKKLRSHFTRA